MSTVDVEPVDIRPQRLGSIGCRLLCAALVPGRFRVAGEAPAGLVTVNGAPAPRRVAVFDMASGFRLGHTVSAADGTWQVSGLPARPVAVWFQGQSGERHVIVAGTIPGE